MLDLGKKSKSCLRSVLIGGISLFSIAISSTAQAADPYYVSLKDQMDAPDQGFWGRFYKAYVDEWGKTAPPSDPNAPQPVTHRPLPFPPAPTSTPPYPFTEWPYGGASTIGATTPNSVDSPLMTALGPTEAGRWLSANHIQIYGWINAGANVSSARGDKDGNFPAAYSYKPNTAELDQAVVYIERLPDTVQQDHIDWGFRLSGIYGENYRYTTAYGVASYQLLKHNHENGYDFPMVYGEVYIPKVADGLVIRAGRYISVPDIEAQLAPNNYMYSHSMTYAFDNYTNTGIIGTLQATKNWLFQFGVSAGTETVPWNTKDPGTQPSFTGCVRWNSDDSYNNVNVCANAINDGQYGYNNLQWYGFTFYHKFDEKWHVAFEMWHMNENHVPDEANGGCSPFDASCGITRNFIPVTVNQPGTAVCKGGAAYCTANEYSALMYLNYKYSDLDNFTFRTEFFDDLNGQRTGVKTRYANWAVGWQHWFSPSLEIRPEVALYNSLDGPAFGRDANNSNPTQSHIVIGAIDTIIHF